VADDIHHRLNISSEGGLLDHRDQATHPLDIGRLPGVLDELVSGAPQDLLDDRRELFELGLGEIALALTAVSSKSDQALIERVFAEHRREGFLAAWLTARGIPWAIDLIPNLNTLEASP